MDLVKVWVVLGCDVLGVCALWLGLDRAVPVKPFDVIDVMWIKCMRGVLSDDR